MVEQIIRPTGLMDPEVDRAPRQRPGSTDLARRHPKKRGQSDGDRVLVTTS